MGQRTVNAGEIDLGLNSLLADYLNDTAHEIEEVTDEVTKEALNMVRSIGSYVDNPKAAERSKKKRKLYRNSFYVKKTMKAAGYDVEAAIGNRVWYLTHLLERGHALEKGGRARKFPHFGPTQEKYGRVYEQRLKNRVERVGR
jgi:hypothetical protein